ncbi:DUF3079 domain-containing protein [Pseudaquabacterium pictum]|uniref:DUF3079 domain-containing protein n=1 Tax=Pseudaquabacterium pictum TaxID=2315236 RepID=A0A480AZ00_9BURK|nr:DUF3079 domain-containing protein [Rubrivivax pictus]GCL65492.1 hypothetical protein AQPW35_45730 [Rubrivivax pictus]
MSKRSPANPAHPERICWGCDRYCPVGSMACGNGSVAIPHPSDLFGKDWESWGTNPQLSGSPDAPVVESQDSVTGAKHILE